MNSSSKFLTFLLFVVVYLFSGCHSENKKVTNDTLVVKQPVDSTKQVEEISDAETIMKRKQIPILCYHHIRDWKVSDSKRSRDYIVPVDTFHNQMKLLADSGYHTISPDELYSYLASGKRIPPKSILLTFDDTDVEQFTVGKSEMDKYGFKAIFFIMTVSLGRPNYMTREQVKQLSDEGHTIGSHTWDHKNVKKYTETDWPVQVDKPTKLLQNITGKPIYYFAYPFGLWDSAAISGLQQRGMRAAFQLSANRDPKQPLFTIRRIIVPGYWSTAAFGKRIKTSF